MNDPTSPAANPDPNVRIDYGGWISGPCLIEPAHEYVRAGQVAPDRAAADACMVCGQTETGHETRRPPVVTPGSTPLRMLARAVADALSLPPPRAEHDEQLRARVLDQRARVVATALRRLSDDHEIDDMDILQAASAIRDRASQIEVNYSVHPMSS